jgi:hypothetical protein
VQQPALKPLQALPNISFNGSFYDESAQTYYTVVSKNIAIYKMCAQPAGAETYTFARAITIHLFGSRGNYGLKFGVFAA